MINLYQTHSAQWFEIHINFCRYTFIQFQNKLRLIVKYINAMIC